MEEPMLPKFEYHLDESDPDVVVLRRQDGAFVAAFSARAATREAIVEAAKEDYWKLIRAQESSPGLQESENQSCSAARLTSSGSAKRVKRATTAPSGPRTTTSPGSLRGVCPVPCRESYVAVASDGGRLLCVRWQRRLVLRFFGSGIQAGDGETPMKPR
jgi:hypothetical protein